MDRPGRSRFRTQVSDLEAGEVGPLGHREAGRLDAQHSHVGARVAAGELRGHGGAVGQADRDVLLPLDVVVRGDDHAVGRPDDAARPDAAPGRHLDDAGPRLLDGGRRGARKARWLDCGIRCSWRQGRESKETAHPPIRQRGPDPKGED